MNLLTAMIIIAIMFMLINLPMAQKARSAVVGVNLAILTVMLMHALGVI